MIYVVSNNLLLKSYEEIEKGQVAQDLQRVSDTLDNMVDQLGVKLIDWAWWDDTYQFMDDRNEDYISSNLGNSSIANLEINTMVFMDNDQNIIFKKLINIGSQKELPFENINDHIKDNTKFSVPSDGSSTPRGIIVLPEGPMLISTSVILTSDGGGAPRGLILFGRFLHEDLISEIARLTHLNVNIYRYDELSLPKDVFQAKKILTESKESNYIVPYSKTNIHGYTILRDVYGNPALIVKIDHLREIYNQGTKTLVSFMILASLTVLVFGILIIVLFESFFLYRFSSLSKDVRDIGETKDFKKRVTEGKRDEIGEFARSINQMLTALSGTMDKEEKFNKEILSSKQKLNERLEEIERMNKLMIDRELKMIELKKQLAQLDNDK